MWQYKIILNDLGLLDASNNSERALRLYKGASARMGDQEFSTKQKSRAFLFTRVTVSAGNVTCRLSKNFKCMEFLPYQNGSHAVKSFIFN